MAPAGCFFALAPGLLPGSPEVCRIHGPGGLFFALTPGLLPGSPEVCRIHGPGGLFFLRWRPASCRAALLCAASMAPGGPFFRAGARPPAGQSLMCPMTPASFFCARCDESFSQASRSERNENL